MAKMAKQLDNRCRACYAVFVGVGERPIAALGKARLGKRWLGQATQGKVFLH